MSTEPRAAHQECGWKQGKIGGGESVQTFLSGMARVCLAVFLDNGMLCWKGCDLSTWVRQSHVSASSKVAGWGPRTQCQTKSVWHSVRNGPIARILLGAEKAPCFSGGLFLRLDEKREGRGGKGVFFPPCLKLRFPKNRKDVWATIQVLCRGRPPRRA
jgi:hypothetical protein